MNRKLLFVLLAAFFAAGCGILEEDLSGRQVRILSPADGVTVAAGQTDFCWTTVDGASGYVFTLVAPSFGEAERIVADTVIYADTLSRRFRCRAELTQGEYQWCVSAFNSGYESSAGVRTLKVVSQSQPE